MTVQELIDQLHGYAEARGPDTDIRIAMQPSWPLAARVASVVSTKEIVDHHEADEPCEHGMYYGCTERVSTFGREYPDVVWIAASKGVGYGEHPYAPREAWT